MSGVRKMTYLQNPQTAGRVLDGLAFVVTTHDRRMVTLNKTGTLVWELAEKGCTVEDVVKALVERYGVAAEMAEKDAAVFLEDLCHRGILVSK